MVISTPEIKAFKIANEYDFIVLASNLSKEAKIYLSFKGDGIYDKLSSRDVVKSVWESTQELTNNIHHRCCRFRL